MQAAPLGLMGLEMLKVLAAYGLRGDIYGLNMRRCRLKSSWEVYGTNSSARLCLFHFRSIRCNLSVHRFGLARSNIYISYARCNTWSLDLVDIT